MENASKALIIAGAILLSILLISLGILVYNQAKGTVSDADMSAEEVQTFNSKFSSYLGTNISGTKVNALVDAVVANNGKTTHPITIDSSDPRTTPRAAADKHDTYTVEVSEYDDNGYIKNITLTQN